MDRDNRLHNLKTKQGIRKKLRNEMTRSEYKLWYFLRRSYLGYKFRRQHGIGPYIADFFCPHLRFIIEVDGDVHGHPVQKKKDKVRQTYLEDLDFNIKHYHNDDILNNIEEVVNDIGRTCRYLHGQRAKSPTTPNPSLSKEGKTTTDDSPIN